MQSRKLSLALLALALGACSVDVSDPGAGESKQAARDRMQRAANENGNGGANAGSDTPVSGPTRPTPPDVCLLQKWYGDGECDAWCPRGDASDCAPSGGGVACAEFWSPADGYCDRRDPCGPVQDEDCQKGAGSQPCDPGDPVGTPRPEPGDGKCQPQSCEDLKADPDCASLICPAVFSPADGKCDAKSACDYLIDEDCAKSCNASGGGSIPCDDGREPDGCGGGTPGNPGVVCPAIRYADDGKCEAAPGCEGSDPNDCAIACDAIRYADNGKCEAPPGCEANDPADCREPVACIDIRYPDNGKCEAAPGCESSDPKDCTGVICLTILYPENGKCEAARGCESSDPDC